MYPQNTRRPTEAFKRHFMEESKAGFTGKFQSKLPASNQQQPLSSGLTYAATDQGYSQQRSQRNYFDPKSSYLAGGDGNIQGIKGKYPSDGKELRSKRSQTKQKKNRAPGATFSESSQSSSRSDSTRRTAIEQGKRGKHLKELVHSRASLMKIVDEGMANGPPEQCCCKKIVSSGQERQFPKEMYHSGSEESNARPSSSAGIINEKIIHPMMKKFRLLYLHNIKEEVTIMEELELLPRKLDEICRKMEKD